METATNPNTPATTGQNKPAKTIVIDNSGDANLMDTARFEQVQRVAQSLGLAAFTPKHLKGATIQETVANCFRVVNQAFRWGMDPFAVADETYVVGGKLGYQGKLVAAVINTRSNLAARLRCEYSGAGNERMVTITGRFTNEDSDRSITLTVAQAKTSNSMWEKDPDQKLYYSGVTKWARRHCPEVILGVLTEDDVERIAEREQRPKSNENTRLMGSVWEQAKQGVKEDTHTVEDVLFSYPNLVKDQREELEAIASSKPFKLQTTATEAGPIEAGYDTAGNTAAE